MKYNSNNKKGIKCISSEKLNRIHVDLAEPSLYHCLIFIEDYGLYQFFSGNQSVFSNDNPCKENNTKVAVISKNIYSSSIPGNNNNNILAGSSNKFFKKSINFKHIRQYYKNESYFLFECDTDKYGIYHTLPANIQKYYSLGIVDLVIPYEYLVILFLNYKLTATAGRQTVRGQSHLLFIEETDKIYKAVAVVNGLNVSQVISFKDDTLKENLNFLQTELNSKKIKIDKIFTNSNDIKPALNGLFLDAEIISFEIKEFFDFFNNIKRDSIPHFENLEIKVKELKHKKNVRNNLFMAILLTYLIVIITGITYLNNVIVIKKTGIIHLNSRIVILNDKISDQKAKSYINKILTPSNIAGYLKKLIVILPKNTKIKNITIVRSKKGYIFRGKGFFLGGYGEFVKDYNKIAEKSSIFKMFNISFNIDKFDQPSFQFIMVIR